MGGKSWFPEGTAKNDIEMAESDRGLGQSTNNKNGSAAAEEEFTEYRPFNLKRFFLTPKYIPVHILAILIGVFTVVITLKHDQVVEALRPFSEKLRDMPAGWLIFVAVLVIISFPPLFGHEIVALLAGVVYGLWIGFAVVAAGTFIGEVGTWYAFKLLLRRKAEKTERTNLTYGAMARLARDGGFWIVLVIRFSVIPSHISTAVFSTADVKFWHFAIATFLTLPKQIIIVYLGVLLVQEQDGSVIQNAVIGVGGIITILSAVWIWFKMDKYKKILLAEQAARKADRAGLNNLATADSSVSRLVGVGLQPKPDIDWQEGGQVQQYGQAYGGGYGQQPSYQTYEQQQQPQYYSTGDIGQARTTDLNHEYAYAAAGYGGPQGSLQAPGYNLTHVKSASSASSVENASPERTQHWV